MDCLSDLRWRNQDFFARVRCDSLPYAVRSVLTCLVVGLLASACGNDGPTSPPNPPPSTPPPPESRLSLFSLGSEDDACTAKTPAWFFSPRATSELVVTLDGGEWDLRPESARQGDVEVRLALKGIDAAGRMEMTGTIRGTVIDVSTSSFPNPNRVTVTDAGSLLTGYYATDFRAAFGWMTGRLVYTDFQGGVTNCTDGSWFLTALLQ